jgi:hypothetical protein
VAQLSTLGDMKFIILIILAVMVCALSFGFMNRFLQVPPSPWYWLCFILSLGVLGGGLVMGLRRARLSGFLTVVAIISSFILVLALDCIIIMATTGTD